MSIMMRRGIGHPGDINPRVYEFVLRQIQIVRDDDRVVVPIQYHFVHIVSPYDEISNLFRSFHK